MLEGCFTRICDAIIIIKGSGTSYQFSQKYFGRMVLVTVVIIHILPFLGDMCRQTFGLDDMGDYIYLYLLHE